MAAKYDRKLSFYYTLQKKRTFCGILCLCKKQNQKRKYFGTVRKQKKEKGGWSMMLKKCFIKIGLYQKLLAFTAIVALGITSWNVHTCCWFILGQDSLPENAKKLRKF